MKRLTYILTVLFLISSCNQKSKKTTENIQIENDKEFVLDSIPIDSDFIIDSGDTINGEVFFNFVEEMPQFGNGWEDIRKYILKNIEYPQTAIDDSIVGNVFVQFVINEDGSLSNPKVIRGIRFDLDEACIRVVKNMPNWKPGKQMGKLAKVRYMMPFRFRLNSDIDKDNIITPQKDKDEKTIDFKIYPNPATEIVNIELSDFYSGLEFEIINTKGQNLKSGQIYNQTEQINISDLENGLYLIRLISNQNRVIKTQKLIKK